MKLTAFAAAALIGSLVFASFGYSQSPQTGGPTPSPPGARVEFIDLKDGAVIGPETTIHFGLHGMDVAPAGTMKANTGHFHLLIDTDLPPLDRRIPNDENHLHFGGGQTEAELSLPPGPHTLQLLLGDWDHIPHTPPVYSEKLHVTVTDRPPPPAPAAPAPGTRHPSPAGARAYIVSPENGANVPETFTVRFGLAKMGVAPAGIDKPNTGHHHLLIDAPLPPFDKPIPNDENHLHFGAGQTETVLTLPKGRHTLQLLLGDASHLPHEPPVYSDPIVVNVGTSPDSAAAPKPATQAPARGTRHPSPAGARAYIVSPDNGAYVPTTFTVRFGLEKMGVAPAGVDKPNTGHHHLLIDAPLPSLDKPIPNDENHLHFGAGQTETTLTLPRGRHTLQLLLGDAFHIPHQPPVYSVPIVVYVGMFPPHHHRPIHRHVPP